MKYSAPVPMEFIMPLSIYKTRKGYFVHLYGEGNKRHYGVKPVDPPKTINGFRVEFEMGL